MGTIGHDRLPYTAVTGLFSRGGKIESRLLNFCQSHVTPLSGMAKFKQPTVTFCLLVKINSPAPIAKPEE
jgi:hypothetical protein